MPARRMNIRRECQHGGRHKHGTHAAYRMDNCRCKECADVNSAWYKQQRRLRAYGRWDAADPFVAAQPVRQHVRALMQQGMGTRQIAQAAGFRNHKTIGNLLYGQHNFPPQRRIRRETATAILAIRIELANGQRIDATGTRRRMQALARQGWSGAELGQRLGLDRSRAFQLQRAHLVTLRTAQRVAALYDDLWDQAPTRPDLRTRRNAERKGWLSPLAWDDDTIDDPAAKPSIGATRDKALDEIAIAEAMHGRKVQLTRAERAEVVRRMTETGWSARRIAERMHTTPRSVTRNRSVA